MVAFPEKAHRTGSRMKAVVCRAYGPPASLVVEDLPAPLPQPGEIVVAARAAGVNFPDTLIVQGKYQFKPEPPFSPGAEVAGVVAATGAGVTEFAVGDRVAASMLWGCHREAVAVPATAAHRVPDGVDDIVAAAVTLTYGTTYHALKDRAQLRPGETLLVLGAAGGVGLAAIELGKLMGARVIAAASSEEKLAVCRRQGADATIDYEREDLRAALKRIAGERGVDVVCDPVGGRYTEPAFRSMAWAGRHLVIGFASGEIPRLPLNLTLLKGAAVVGVFWGQFARLDPAANRANMDEVMAWIATGRLRPLVSRTYPLAQAAAALDDMMNRRIHGKVVLTV
jgi:NADPH2:quinone reductase